MRERERGGTASAIGGKLCVDLNLDHWSTELCSSHLYGDPTQRHAFNSTQWPCLARTR
jgi:hypothetical protein